MLFLVYLGKTNSENYQIRNGSLIIEDNKILMITGILSLHFTIPSEQIKHYLSLFDGLTEEQDQLIRMSCGPYLNIKQKRGLVNIGGKILQILFGTATENQLQEMKEKIIIQSKHMEEIHLYTNEMLKKMITVKDAVLTHHKKQAKDHLKMWTIELCLAYHLMMTDAQAGIIDLLSFNKTQIKEEIKQFSESTGLRPISSPENPNFGKSLKISAINQKHLSIAILFTNGKEYRNLLIKGFPMFVKHQSNYKIKVKLVKTRILISPEDNYYSTPEDWNPREGININNKTYVRPVLLKTHSHSETCEVSLIKGDPRNCKYEKVPMEEITIIETYTYVFISTKPGETITTRCEQRLDHYIVPISGIVVHPIGCSMYNHRFEINSIISRNGKLTSKKPKIIEKAIIENNNVTLELEKLPMDHIPFNPNIHYHNLYISTYLLWAIAGTGTTLVLLIYVKYYSNLLFRKRKKNDPTGVEPKDGENEEIRLDN